MSELQEMGNIQYPSMSFLAWEAQYFDYYRDLLNIIEASTVPGTLDFAVNVYNNVRLDFVKVRVLTVAPLDCDGRPN